MDAAVQKELDKVRNEAAPTAAELDVAKRSINRLGKESKELAQASHNDMMELYIAMKRAKGPSARINSAMLLGWNQQQVQTTKLKQNFYVVPRQGREHFLKDLAEYIVDPANLPDLPVTFDPAQSIIMDDSAPRGKLGLGVQVMELAAGIKRQRQVLDGSADPAAVGQAAAPSLPNSSSSAPQKDEEQSRLSLDSRVLKGRPSDPAAEKDTAEEIARHLKKAFDAGRLYSQDPMCTTTVAFWLKKYQAHLELLAQNWQKDNVNKNAAEFLDSFGLFTYFYFLDIRSLIDIHLIVTISLHIYNIYNIYIYMYIIHILLKF